jgi:NADH-quinone oxidoreductase subunit G
MADPIKLTIDGRELQSQPGTLLINAAKQAGIAIPAFCYYDGLSLQAACRMCLVEVEKTPKLQVACTLPVAEGMVVHTDSATVRQARKGTLEFLLTNHPLDCPVCDKGGECELQDMVFRYGAGESRFRETKGHVEEKQWSPVVFYDAPRCILCYRCVRICGEGLGVNALGVGNRGSAAEIVPNKGDHLECDECGACIDICPVGALTSGTYRYKTRPWEMEHVGTICTHCSNGCKTTLGVRNGEIIRANNRDKSGINGEFLCVKGRYGFDFNQSPSRLTSPLLKTANGELRSVSWAVALATVAKRFSEFVAKGGRFGVIGSNHTTNEENYLLQKFTRQILKTSNIDHHRTGDLLGLLAALRGRKNTLATTADLSTTKAALVVDADLSQEHPLLAYLLRTNARLSKGKVWAVTPGPVREDDYATVKRAALGEEFKALEELKDALSAEPELVILFGAAIKGLALYKLVAFGDSLGIPVKYVCLLDYANSRGASDMGVLPDLLPGYHNIADGGLSPGMNYDEMLTAPNLDALWVVGSNPLARRPLTSANAFLVVQDLFLTETAKRANVVLPAASAYEKNGTVTNVCGGLQKLTRAAKTMGAKSDLEIIALLAKEMRSDWVTPTTETVFQEIRRLVLGYDLPLAVIETGGVATTTPATGELSFRAQPELVRSSGNTLFTSGSMSKYSHMLNAVMESPGALYGNPVKKNQDIPPPQPVVKKIEPAGRKK